jgi:hypothetical protein
MNEDIENLLKSFKKDPARRIHMQNLNSLYDDLGLYLKYRWSLTNSFTDNILKSL